MLRRLLLPALLALSFLAPACGSSYVRLRGTTEVHTTSCPLVRGAHRGGVVDANDDEPPCHRCRPEEAVEWAEDQY